QDRPRLPLGWEQSEHGVGERAITACGASEKVGPRPRLYRQSGLEQLLFPLPSLDGHHFAPGQVLSKAERDYRELQRGDNPVAPEDAAVQRPVAEEWPRCLT